MAVIESNNRILRAGDSPVGTRYFDGDYIHIDENNHINFTGDFSGLSAKVDECCADAHGQLSSIKGSVSSLSSEFVDCCSSVNTDLTNIWNAVNANSANKLDKSAFNNFIEAGFYPNINTLYNNDGYLSAVINTKLDASASGDIVPWITAWKNVSNNLTANFGDTYCVLSSIDVSGNKNHAVGVKGSYITLPTTGHIASALDDRLTLSSFSSYTSYADGRMDSIFQLANSAYTTAVNNYYNKADKSALSSYVPYSAIGGTTNIITGINGSALSAGANYTEGPNIKITGNEISGKDWTDDITAASANAVNEAVNNITAVSYANSSNVSNSALTANYALSSDSATYDNLGREITATYLTAVTGDNVAYTAGANIDITNHVISGKDWSNDITAASSYAYNQATAAANVYDVAAGDNINVATADNTFTISGKDWTDTITAASSNAVNEAINTITAVSYAATANISNSALTANYALSSDSATYDSDGNKITETYLSALPEGVITTANTFVSSVNNLTPELVSGGINGHELKLSGSTPTGLPLSGLDPIKIEKTGGKVVISMTGGVGNTYTGIAPIVVDNVEDKISADVAILTAEAPVYIESATVGNYIYNTINYSGIRYSQVLGGADNSNAKLAVTHERANLPITTDWYQLSLINTSGNTGNFSLIPSDIQSGFLYAIGNGGIAPKSVRESKIYNYDFVVTENNVTLQLTAKGYSELHLTTPYRYDGPDWYTASVDSQTFVLGSGAYANICYQDVEGASKWCLMNSGYYSI